MMSMAQQQPQMLNQMQGPQNGGGQFQGMPMMNPQMMFQMQQYQQMMQMQQMQ